MSDLLGSFFRITENIVTYLSNKIPLVKSLLSKSCRLKAFVFFAVTAVAFVSFNTAYFITSSIYRGIVEKNAFDVSRSVSSQVMDSMLQLMEKGWTRAELETFFRSYNGKTDQPPYRVEIYRGPIVEELYGRAGQGEMDAEVRTALEKGVSGASKANYTIKNTYPIVAEDKCLRCHSNARPGNVLGVVRVIQDTERTITRAEKKIAVIFFVLLPVPLLMVFFIIIFLNAKIHYSTELFHEKIRNIGSVRDLTKLDMGSINLSFDELNLILLEIDGFVKRMKDVAVDKRILEFELQVLEKFIITSEVVRDWKEHVSNLLIEINTVIEAYTLFSIFQVDEEIYDLEIFWVKRPTETTKARVEKIIAQRVMTENLQFNDFTKLQFNHHISRPDGELSEIEEHDLELQTKSLILQTPQIGGVVGIGVQSELTKDPIRSLVIDGVLTTLLNVVGSIKAIYKYTKDLEYYATRDPLTNLYNQRVFWELIGYEIGRATRYGYKFSLLVIDLDNFKNINDSYGHVFGDKYLCRFALKIKDALRNGDILGRYGGDEFVVVLPEADETQAYFVASRVRDFVEEFSLETPDGTKVKATVSVGMGVFPDHADNPQDLFIFADNMMYKAKSEGKNRVLIPTRSDIIEVFRDLSEKTNMITKAIEEKKIIPYFQPIMNMETEGIECYEVLSRIETDRGVLNACEFIEIAEKLGVISKLDLVLMENVFEKVTESGYGGSLFVNLSPRSLILSEFMPSVLKLTRRFGIDNGRIVFEITERDTLKNITLLEKFIDNLKFEGFQFAIDDFGSGFSSFHYLKRFPLDFVKIEGEFIRNMIMNEKDMAIVKTLLVLTREFKIRTVAEYVEHEDIYEAVKKLGIDYSQGYFVGKPSPELLTK